MTTAANPTSASASDAGLSASKRRYLEVAEREHAITMRVLRAYPTDQLDLRPSERSKSARELAWVFVAERGLAKMLLADHFASGAAPGRAPEPPASWEAILDAYERAHRELMELVRGTPDEELAKTSRFFVAPRQMGDVGRMEFLWFLLHDEIHHRGQFSVYLRMAGAKVPSIYGPTADEPWM